MQVSETDDKQTNMMLRHLRFDVLQHTNLSILLVIKRTVLAHRRRIFARSENAVMGWMIDGMANVCPELSL
jgi:hypothetical protein